MRPLLLVVPLLMLCACDPAKKDLETICHVRERVKMPAGADDEKQQAVITEYLTMNVHSPKVRSMVARFGSKSAEEKAQVLRKEAANEGISPCPLADEFDPPNKPAKPAAAQAPAPAPAPATAEAAPSAEAAAAPAAAPAPAPAPAK